MRPSSISISAAITAPSPIPPYSSGVWTPKKPDCLALSCSARSSSSGEAALALALALEHLRLERHELLGDEGAHPVADLALLVGEGQVHRRP